MVRTIIINKIPFILLFILIQPAITSNAQNLKELLPGYSLDIMIDPDSSFLKCRAEITNPRDSVFYLTKGMQVTGLYADTRHVSLKQAIDSLPNTNIRISLPAKPQKLEITYSGRITPENYPKTITAVNMVNKNLVELSDQIRWYPSPASDGHFGYTLRLDMPVDYVTVTNSTLSNTFTDKNRIITIWKTDKPTWNISVVSAPGLKKTEVEKDGIRIEIYSSKLPQTYIDSMKFDLIDAYHDLARLFGSPGAGNLVRLIYSPRSAGGYARAPLIIVSEKFALEQRNRPLGYARDLRLNIHEIAHYWSMADTNTPDDWLNEGLAEFAALMISGKIAGNEFYEVLLKEYRDIIRNSKIRTSIAETQANSGEREINRYYKPALLLNDLWRKYGNEKFYYFISSFYASSVKAKGATTGIFMDELEKCLGKDERDSFYEAITMKKPDESYIDTETSDVSIDPAFVGTWKGILSQFGADLQFVLNVSLMDGKPHPTLDSPDQEIKDIPVTALHVTGDSIYFHVPVASGVFKGILDREKMLITGFWNQRGTDYPLTLKNSNQ
jgi:hypothetical protein